MAATDPDPLNENKVALPISQFQQNFAHTEESQLVTELTSVIAELRRQLGQKEHVLEEVEEDDEYFEDDLVLGSGSVCSGSVEGESESTDTKTNKRTKTDLEKVLQELTLCKQEQEAIRGELRLKEENLAHATIIVRKCREENALLRGRLSHLEHHLLHPSTIRTASVTKTNQIKGPDLLKLGLSTRVVESIVRPNPHHTHTDLELQRLQSKLDSFRCSNEVLQLKLEEAKHVNEKLMGVVGRLESDVVGMRIVVERSDETIEGYDVLVALLESELGQLLANCRAAGIGNGGNGENVNLLLRRANQNRMTALTAAKKLLNVSEWGEEEEYVDSGGSFNGGSVGSTKSLPRSEESQIRSQIIKLKTERERVRSTLSNSSFPDMEDLLVEKCDSGVGRRMDLETAVLMQELLASREDQAELRMQLFLCQKERDCLLEGQGENTSLQQLHESNALLLQTLEEVKRKYKERVGYLEGVFVNKNKH